MARALCRRRRRSLRHRLDLLTDKIAVRVPAHTKITQALPAASLVRRLAPRARE
jgi:hypothetical protein